MVGDQEAGAIQAVGAILEVVVVATILEVVTMMEGIRAAAIQGITPGIAGAKVKAVDMTPGETETEGETSAPVVVDTLMGGSIVTRRPRVDPINSRMEVKGVIEMPTPRSPSTRGPRPGRLSSRRPPPQLPRHRQRVED